MFDTATFSASESSVRSPWKNCLTRVYVQESFVVNLDRATRYLTVLGELRSGHEFHEWLTNDSWDIRVIRGIRGCSFVSKAHQIELYLFPAPFARPEIKRGCGHFIDQGCGESEFGEVDSLDVVLT